MAMPFMSVSNPTPSLHVSSLESISGRTHLQFFPSIRSPQLALYNLPNGPFKTTTIRMGGGPRTYPGGVSKWQWKRMQAKKAKQLLKARLARERQIYEMRKRAELKAAVSELERPWEAVEKAPTLFSVSADEQLKVLADRFQRPGGFDMWSERDGPQLFRPDDGLPSARFFPKGVVHSIKPYGKVENFDDDDDVSDQVEGSDVDTESDGGAGSRGVRGNRFVDKHWKLKTEISNGEKISALLAEKKHRNPDDRGKGSNTKFTNSYNRRNVPGRSNSRNVGRFRGNDGASHRLSDRDSRRGKVGDSKSEVFYMTLRRDGSYELEEDKRY